MKPLWNDTPRFQPPSVSIIYTIKVLSSRRLRKNNETIQPNLRKTGWFLLKRSVPGPVCNPEVGEGSIGSSQRRLFPSKWEKGPTGYWVCFPHIPEPEV